VRIILGRGGCDLGTPLWSCGLCTLFRMCWDNPPNINHGAIWAGLGPAPTKNDGFPPSSYGLVKSTRYPNKTIIHWYPRICEIRAMRVLLLPPPARGEVAEGRRGFPYPTIKKVRPRGRTKSQILYQKSEISSRLRLLLGDAVDVPAPQ